MKKYNTFKIGNKILGTGHPVYIVAEAGINHNGDMNIAKNMIREAASIGVNAIKFQTIFPDELFSQTIHSEWYEMAKKWHLNKKQHLELQNYAKKCNIDFFSTPVGIRSAKILKDIKSKVIKIASGELTNLELIRFLAKSKTPLIVSTGMSTISEIVKTVEIIKEENCPFILLHCNASYPTPIEDVNLSNIKYLNEIFSVPIGFSDHTVGNESCLAAVAMGACVIEKHFTLDKNMDGPDQQLSSDVNDFKELVKQVRIIEKTFGVIRTGPTKSEKQFRSAMRKSVGIKISIKRGTKLTHSMLTGFRPGTGIPISMMSNFVGMTVTHDIKEGSLLKWDMFR
jgi:N,N'-diacetyllegionaminate synthase